VPHGRRGLLLVLAMSVAFAACATRFDPSDLRNPDAASDSMDVTHDVTSEAVADRSVDSQPVADSSDVVDAVVMIDSPVADVACGGCPTGMTCCGSSCRNLQTDPANCSVCGATCPGAWHAVPVCTLGTCGTQCAAGYGDCDGLASNGCETTLATSVASCGRCGNACILPAATALCSSGTCVIGVCAHGYFDCNAMAADGCETHCGGGPSCCP
jgi:hypothetical protein